MSIPSFASIATPTSVGNTWKFTSKQGSTGVGNFLFLGDDRANPEMIRDGNDIYRLAGGDDVANSGGGNDRLLGQAGRDTLHGGGGNDLVSGGADSDHVYGDEGNDTLLGGAGNDTLDGGIGNDVLIGGGGNDTLTGGEGADIFRYDMPGAAQHFRFTAFGQDTITDFKHGEDKLDLSGLLNRLDDDNLLYVQSLFDNPLPADGSTGAIQLEDSVTGDKISMVLQHVSGPDGTSLILKIQNLSAASDKGATITFTNSAQMSWSDLVASTHFLQHGTDGVDKADFSAVTTGRGVDYFAFGGNDTVTGTALDDSLRGGSGNDVLNGGDGNDELSGGNGADVLNGGKGDDFLYGGSGKNTLTGGEGHDVFIIGGKINTIGGFSTDSGVTHITDFTVGEDVIRFANLGDDYAGSLANSRLEQPPVLNTDAHDGGGSRIFIQRGDDLYFRTGDQVIVFDHFFDGHNIFDGHVVNIQQIINDGGENLLN